MKKYLLFISTLLLVVGFYGSCDSFSPMDVSEGNNPVVSTDLVWAVEEDGSLSIDVVARDPRGESMTLSITTPPQHGTAVVAGSGAQATPVARREATPAQELPEVRRAAPKEKRLPEEKPALPRWDAPPKKPSAQAAAKTSSIQVHTQVFGPSVALSASAVAVVVGRIRYTPADDYFGEDRFTFAVTNTSGFVTPVEVTVTIDAVGDPPRVMISIPDTSVTLGDSIKVDLNTFFRDPEGDPITFSARSGNRRVAKAHVTRSTLTVTGQAHGR